jgi:hypothetical protein
MFAILSPAVKLIIYIIKTYGRSFGRSDSQIVGTSKRFIPQYFRPGGLTYPMPVAQAGLWGQEPQPRRADTLAIVSACQAFGNYTSAFRGLTALSLPTFQLSPVGSSDWSKRFELSIQAAERSSPAGSSGRQRSFIHFNSCRSSRHGDRELHAILAN